MVFTSNNAIQYFLPAGGKAQALTMNYTNPVGVKNVLAGHLVALSLSVGFDEADADFGEAGITLGAMKVKNRRVRRMDSKRFSYRSQPGAGWS